ncbi:sodium/glucose cotransporter-like protein [Dinothrombium tinctorium]|uniref:Sodium/glucose cotransporter-like protein n=1 Tax=Dinothrombium tinctorium TaxID=1965070 RepID=A0A443REP9_9ACAR|nr:sodium/glucose cotransporter-like protein [Dinothrombium tinctorium]
MPHFTDRQTLSSITEPLSGVAFNASGIRDTQRLRTNATYSMAKGSTFAPLLDIDSKSAPAFNGNASHSNSARPQQQPQRPSNANPRASVRVAYPLWCKLDSKELPELYVQIWNCVRQNDASPFCDTSKLYPILLSSKLHKDVLANIWAQVNRVTPGQLTFQELFLALAMIAILQQNPTQFLNVKQLYFITVPPVPSLCVPYLSAQQMYDNFLKPNSNNLLFTNQHSETKVSNLISTVPTQLSTTTVSNRTEIDDEFSDFQSVAAPKQLHLTSTASVFDVKNCSNNFQKPDYSQFKTAFDSINGENDKNEVDDFADFQSATFEINHVAKPSQQISSQNVLPKLQSSNTHLLESIFNDLNLKNEKKETKITEEVNSLNTPSIPAVCKPETEDRYSAFKELSNEKNNSICNNVSEQIDDDDFGDFKKTNEFLVWTQVLQCCKQILHKTFNVLAVNHGEDCALEALSTEEGREFCLDIGALYQISQRIKRKYRTYGCTVTNITNLLDDIDVTFRSLNKLFQQASIEVQIDDECQNSIHNGELIADFELDKVGASLFASNIGSGHFVGLAGSGAKSGITASYIILLLGWIFVPVYTASGVYTMPEYLQKRFGGQRIRVYLAVLALMLSIFTKISADLYAGAIFIKQSLDWDLYASVCLLLVIASVFTIAGGLSTVIWTDFVQTILMVIGALFLMIKSLNKVGGIQKLFHDFPLAEPTNQSYITFDPNMISCSKVSSYYNHLLKPVTDLDLPWTGLVFGLAINSIWYWCSDQVIVQRALSSKNLSHAKGGCLLAAVLKLLPMYLLVLPGMASRVLFPNEIACSNPQACKQVCGSEIGCSNIAYPLLVLKLMPMGATGLMLSVMMAALMSSLTSIFNSSATIFTIDIWKRLRKNCTEVEQVIVGRIFVILLVIISVLWIPIIEAMRGSELFHYMQSVTSYLSPPICAVYVLSVLWERITEPGAFWGLMVGLFVGCFRFVSEIIFRKPPCGPFGFDERPALISKVHYLHFSIILFSIVAIVTISISLLTKPIDSKYLYRLTFWTRFSDQIRVDIDSDKKVAQISNASSANGNEVIQLEKISRQCVTHPDEQITKQKPQQKFTKWLLLLCCLRKEYKKSQREKQTSFDEIDQEAVAKKEALWALEKPIWSLKNKALKMDSERKVNSYNEFKVLQWPDFFAISLYFMAMFLVGFITTWKSRGTRNVSSYFLASKSMHWIPVGASLFASNIGSGHFVGLAGGGANSGISIAGFELCASYILLLLGWIFVPVYISAGVQTMPEYLKKRFGGQRIRIYLAILALVLSIFTKISADLYAGAIFIKQAMGWNLYGSVVLLLTVACAFTIAGGLTAIIWSDLIQTILMLLGALYLMILSMNKVGGIDRLFEEFPKAEPTNSSYAAFDKNGQSCSKVTPYYSHLLKPITDTDLPWTGLIFGQAINGIWYWCSDQVIVQRALSSKNLSHAKGGVLMAALLKFFPMFLLVFPGMAARILYPDKVACSNPQACKQICGSERGCTNIAYPLLVIKLMPIGATGIMLSVMMAALMSSLTSILNSSSTIFTIDIWKRFRPNCSEVEQVLIGRIFVLLMVIASVLWIPLIELMQGSELFHYIQSVSSYLSPPICAVYVLAILWERINEKGAFYGLMAGLVVGCCRFALEIIYNEPICGPYAVDERPKIISKIHYLHFSLILFAIVCIVTIGISLLTEPIDPKHLHRLTFWTRFSDQVRINISSKQVQTANGILKIEYEPDQEKIEMMEKEIVGYENSKASNEQPISQVPWFKATLLSLCCLRKEYKKAKVEKRTAKQIERDEEALAKLEATWCHEEPIWSRVCNIGAIVMIILTTFLLGYYA